MTSRQCGAVAHIRKRAERAREEAHAGIRAIVEAAGESLSAVDALCERIHRHGEVTINFHPDRVRNDGRTVAEGLLLDGVYHNQFQTGLSNGSRTAYIGGDRDIWERKLFGPAYAGGAAELTERPKYGALNLMQHADGGSPRFGSCYFVLRRHVNGRCTFSWGDSHVGPEHVGTMDTLEPIVAAMLQTARDRGSVLGVDGAGVSGVIHGMLTASGAAVSDPSRPPGRALDDYVEAQVHGPIDLATDVSTLVVDPAFETTATGAQLRHLCDRHGIELRRHGGFVIAHSAVPSDFRGPRMIPLAERLVRHYATEPRVIDAAAIGRAALALHTHPDAWADWGTYDETLQHLKQIWHILVRFGHGAFAASLERNT